MHFPALSILKYIRFLNQLAKVKTEGMIEPVPKLLIDSIKNNNIINTNPPNKK